MKKLVPILVLLLSILAGGGGGFLMKKSRSPSSAKEEVATGPDNEVGKKEHGVNNISADKEKGNQHPPKKDGHGQKAEDAAYMKFSRQFVAPIVKSGRPVAMMVMDIMLELDPSTAEAVYPREPKLRDAIMKVLLKQAGEGRLAQLFQDPKILEETKYEILTELQPIVGDGLRSVLIMDLGYQEY